MNSTKPQTAPAQLAKGKTLVIAEKPSVAADLARALGKIPKKTDHYENDQWIIASAVGHLVELEMPEDIDKKKYGFWRLDTLPIIPKKFGLKPISKTRKNFDILKKLLSRKDVSLVINACDAGREGELIFTYIYQLANAKIPVKRAWMQSMTPAGIRQAFEKLRPAEEMLGLADAARCRSESDWLIGINGTRAITKRMLGSRSGNVASVGRVQTPTLAIVCAREEHIRNFKPATYWRITATFRLNQGEYEAVYHRPQFKKDPANEHDRPDRLWDKPLAEAIFADCKTNSRAKVTEEKKPASQTAPRLYDLTTLQREANQRLGLSARRTLQIAQALYERHKVITYPRTDSRALPEDYGPTVKETLAALGGELATHAQKVLSENWVKTTNKKIFNNAQVSDHFAIIPTTTPNANLDEIEARVFDMIARRFVAVFYPDARYDVTTRITTVAEKHPFKAEGRVLTEPGWLTVYGKTAELAREATAKNSSDEDSDTKPTHKTLPPLTSADAGIAITQTAQLHQETTKPPPRYTEASLLSAMESAGKLVDDETMAEAMKERGLGTPATRAEIIDGLIAQKYLLREGRELIPTAKAEQLLQFLTAVKAEALTQPAMTGEWEYKLRQMEHGKYSREKFMQEIIQQTCGLVQRIKDFEDDHTKARVTDIPSPTDQKPLIETFRAYKSQDDLITIYKIISGRKIQENEIRELLTHGHVGPLDGFISPRNGSRFPAKLRLAEDPKNPGKKIVELDFGAATDISEHEPFWTHPDTGAQLCETATKYILREKDTRGNWQQTFSISRILCRRPLTREDIITLITTGKSPLIENFISRFGKPFKAFLVRDGDKANFEFPPRQPNTDDSPSKTKKNTAPDLSTAEHIGDSPAHKQAALYATHEEIFAIRKDKNNNTSTENKPRVVFQTKRQVCGKDITPELIQQILRDGRSDLITGFTSKAGKPFDAYLVLSKDKKKIQFEFPPR